MYKPNPYNPFSLDPTEEANYKAHEESIKEYFNSFPTEDLEQLRKDFYNQNYKIIDSYVFEQGNHANYELMDKWAHINSATLDRRKQEGFETVVLRQIAIVDTTVKFTFTRDNQMYRVAVSHVMSLTRNAHRLDEIIEGMLQRYFGVQTKFKFDYLSPLKTNDSFSNVTNIEGMLIRSLTEDELQSTSQIQKALSKSQASSLVCEYNRGVGKSDWRDKVDNALWSIAPKDPIKRMGFFHTMLGGLFLNLSKKLRTKSTKQYFRDYHLVAYLAVKCFINELKEASLLLTSDLMKLEAMGCIKGNLVKYNVLSLADTVGDGKERCIVFCYPILTTAAVNVLPKLCEYAVLEGTEPENIKSVSKDEPNIIDINSAPSWEIELKKG